MATTAWNPALPRHWPWRRLLLAIGISVLVHYLIADSWRSSGGTPPAVAVLPQLQARVALPAELLSAPASEHQDIPSDPAQAQPLAKAMVQAPRATPPAPALPEVPRTPGAGAAVPDQRFYLARDLDQYPAPLVPLNLPAVAGRSGSVRLWLNIDRDGNVVDVSVVNADPSAALETMVREYLLANRFVPAVKETNARSRAGFCWNCFGFIDGHLHWDRRCFRVKSLSLSSRKSAA